MTKPWASDGPFHLDADIDWGRLRRAIMDAGYNDVAVARVVGDPKSAELDFEFADRMTRDLCRASALMRLFVLGTTVPEDAVRGALGDEPFEDALVAGLLARSGEGISSESMVFHAEDMLIAHDRGFTPTEKKPRQDNVMGVTLSTLAIAGLCVFPKGGRALELGTGAGMLAIAAADEAASVVATDINLRALHFAQFSARLNEKHNLEFRHGSMYEPVKGDRFDLIAYNPPFFISPRVVVTYRDGGMEGDRLAQMAVENAHAHLTEGGYATMIMDWGHADESDWEARPRQWLEGRGVDAWILRFHTRDPLTYAADWLRRPEGADRKQYGALLDSLASYYAGLGIGAISHGAIIQRRRTEGDNWIRADTFPAGTKFRFAGKNVVRVFENETGFGRHRSDEKFLDGYFEISPEHELLYTLKLEQGNWAIKSARLLNSPGIEAPNEVDRLVSTMLAGCDGSRTLRQIAGDVAKSAGAPVDYVAAKSVEVFRRLASMGLVAARRGKASEE